MGELRAFGDWRGRLVGVGVVCVNWCVVLWIALVVFTTAGRGVVSTFTRVLFRALVDGQAFGLAIAFYENKGADVKRDWDVVHLNEMALKHM